MKKILTMAAMAALLAGCSKDDGGASGRMDITIDPTITTRATEVDFEDNDRIGVTITTSNETHADNLKFVFDGDKKLFAPESPMLWYEDVNRKATLFAYYPYVPGGTPSEFTVAADQNGDGYGASDLMTALKSDVTPTKYAVNMTFRHKMVRLILNVENETDHAVTKIVLKNTIGTAAIDAATNAVAAKADGGLLDITAREVTADKKYYALVVPQSARIEIAVTTAEGVRTQGFAETMLESGKFYELGVKVLDKDLYVTIGGPIDEWEEGGEIPSEGDGTIEENTIEYAGVKYKTVTLKDGNIWMAEPLRFIPAGKTPSSDPTAASGIWYPYSSDGTDVVALTDAASIAKYGYLYDIETALGGVILTEDNHKTFEGSQGICPDGWHIPTLDECMTIGCQASRLSAWDEAAARVNTESPYYDSAYSAGRVTTLDADGFNFTFSGARMQASPTGVGSYIKNIYDDHLSMNYIHGSSGYQYQSSNGNIQMLALMTTYNAGSYSDGRLTVGFLGHKYGAAIRCIKDKE